MERWREWELGGRDKEGKEKGRIPVDNGVPDLARLGGEESSRGQSAQAGELVGRGPAVDGAGQVLDGAGVVRERLQAGSNGSAGLHDRGMVQAVVAAAVGVQVQADALRARRLAPHGDAVRVASERGDVLLYPLHRQPLVEETRVRTPLGEHLRRLQEAPHAEPVVHRHGEQRPAQVLRPPHDAAEVVLRVGRAAGIEPAAVDPDQNRQGLACGRRTGSDDCAC